MAEASATGSLTPKTSKKRLRNVPQWTRTKRKRLRNSGQAYVTHKKVQVRYSSLRLCDKLNLLAFLVSCSLSLPELNLYECLIHGLCSFGSTGRSGHHRPVCVRATDGGGYLCQLISLSPFLPFLTLGCVRMRYEV